MSKGLVEELKHIRDAFKAALLTMEKEDGAGVKSNKF